MRAYHRTFQSAAILRVGFRDGTGTYGTDRLFTGVWLSDQALDISDGADGDIHIALVDANGNNVGTVSAEIPVGPNWCDIRQTVFGWTTQKFPFGVKTAHRLKIGQPHVIAVTGKAFYDFAHAPADHSNRRRTPKDYAVWEIYPVIALRADQ